MDDVHSDPVEERALLEAERVGSVLLWMLFGLVASLAVTALTVPLWGWP